MKSGIIWKLLKTHISKGQMAGFAAANLIGLTIVLIGLQFYEDVKPVFADEDSFIRKDYLVITKKVGNLSAFQSLIGGTAANSFSDEEIAALHEQEWVRNIGKFTTSNYPIYGTVSLTGKNIALRTSFFFESVPDEFIDVKNKDWHFDPESPEVPIIISKDYLSLYNFGFAASQGMPQLSEDMVGMVPIRFRFTGQDGRTEYISGKIVGFSNRLNTIIVPDEFMAWSNNRYAPGIHDEPSRLIVEVSNPGDIAIENYMEQNGYEIAGDKMNSSKANYMLTIVMGIVITVGLVICLLSFFILSLSIHLLLQKNIRKLQDLLLLGYSPADVSALYIRMVIYVNAAVFILSVTAVLGLRTCYLPCLETFAIGGASTATALLTGLTVIGLITAGNAFAIKRKVASLWHEEK